MHPTMGQILRRLVPILLVISVLALGWAFIFIVPDHLVHRDLIPIGPDRVKARHDARATLLQSLVGVLVLVGGYIAWQQLRVSREGQITERFTKAVDQLGSTQMDVRLGGLYALERIARDSITDRSTVLSIMAAFIRGHSPWPPSLPGQYVAEASNNDLPVLDHRAPDVEAALSIMGRLPNRRITATQRTLWAMTALGRPFKGFDQALDKYVSSIALVTPNLSNVDLRKARLMAPNLSQAVLNGANLQHSFIYRGNFDQCILDHADLRGGQFMVCTFRKASLEDANLEGAILIDVKLDDADLSRANLEKAELAGARLATALLANASLKAARASKETTWPDNFDPAEAGVTIE
jgi:hypothetical protein